MPSLKELVAMPTEQWQTICRTGGADASVQELLAAALAREEQLGKQVARLEARIDHILNLRPFVLKGMNRIVLLLSKKRLTLIELALCLDMESETVKLCLRELLRLEQRRIRVADYRFDEAHQEWVPVYEGKAAGDPTPLLPDEPPPFQARRGNDTQAERMEVVQRLLHAHHMTCRELAKVMRVSVSTMSKVLAYMHQEGVRLVRICDYCRASNGSKWTAIYEARLPGDSKALPADAPLPADKTPAERTRAHRERKRNEAANEPEQALRVPFCPPVVPVALLLPLKKQPVSAPQRCSSGGAPKLGPGEIRRDPIVSALFGNGGSSPAGATE